MVIFIINQVLNTTALNHGANTYKFVVNFTSNNSSPSIIHLYFSFVFSKLELILYSFYNNTPHTYFLPLLFICIYRRERGRIPGGKARNWVTYTKTTHYYCLYEGSIKECSKILVNSASLLNLSPPCLLCKSLYSFLW